MTQTAAEIIEELVYINYAHNRTLAPSIAPESWAKIYKGVDAMEARYQAELAAEAALLKAKGASDETGK